MILEKFIYKTINKIYCVEAYNSSTQEVLYNLLVMQNKKGKIGVIAKFEKIVSEDELFSKIEKNSPIAFVLSGKDVIVKKGGLIEGQDSESAIEHVFPNMNTEDFFCQYTESNDNEFFVSIARKDVIKKYVDFFASNQCMLTTMHLAPMVNDIIGNISNDYTQINTRNASLTFRNGKISEYVKSNEETKEYMISGEVLSSETISLFSAGVHFFSNYGVGEKYQPEIVSSREELTFFKLKKMVGLFTLFSLFGLLLINFILYSRYSQKYNDTATRVEQYSDLMDYKDSLALNINKKKQCISDLGLTRASRYSFYSDRLLKIMPSGIRLMKLEIDPAILNESEGTISFTKNNILITGRTGSSVKINQWINEIKNYDWVKSVNLQNYKKDNADNFASFNIEITINS